MAADEAQSKVKTWSRHKLVIIVKPSSINSVDANMSQCQKVGHLVESLFGESILLALKHEATPLWRSRTTRERGMQDLWEVSPSEKPWFGVVLNKVP